MFFGLMMKSMITGTYANLDNAMIKSSTGYLQIQNPKYWDDKNIDNSLDLNGSDIMEVVNSTPGIGTKVPKLDYFALASTGNITKGVAIIGTDASVEKEMSNMDTKVLQGQYFSGKAGAAMVPKNLAEYLELEVGDTFVLFGQGYHGVTAAGKFWAEGIIDLRIPMMNNTLIYIQLEDAQFLFGAEGRLTHLSIMIDDPNELYAIQEELTSKIDASNYRVMNWKEMNADYVQMASSKDVSSGIMIGILYLIVGFGIFGTLFMMTLERRREFSVMISIGMKRFKLSIVVFIESLLLGMVGGLAGIGLSLPLLAYLHKHPIPLSGDIATMYEAYGVEPEYHFAFAADFIINQFLVIFILCVVLSIVPIISVNRLNFVNALRGR
tara:strand:+ start:5754 stop:6896 length:1143 start_codon:yes stop_codon:yes gene_type:complete